MTERKQNKQLGFIGYIAESLDVFGVIALSYIIHYIYLDSLELEKEYIQSLVFCILLMVIIFPNFGIYQSWRGRSKLERARSITIAWLTVVVTLIIISTVLKLTTAYSRVWYFSWALVANLYLIFYRNVLDIILNQARKAGWNQKNIIIFGAGELGKTVENRLSTEEWIGFNVKAFFDDSSEKIDNNMSSTPVLPSSDIDNFIEENQIVELWIALPLRNEERVKELLHQLRHHTISIKYIPDIFAFNLLNQKVSEIAGVPVLQLNGTPIQGVNRIVKEIEDKFLSLIILILISPIMLAVAIAIKLESKGPIFFKQIRHGWNGGKIKVYKFRSMYVHKEEDGKCTQAQKNDKRITRVGGFIRKTSLDELPQFFNVLQGRMSIVGPRPHAVAHNEEYKDRVNYYMQRHKVKPGITGWAQINGLRGETDTLDKMSKRVEYDLFYIENWSIWFDLKIIIATVFKGFSDDNAY